MPSSSSLRLDSAGQRPTRALRRLRQSRLAVSAIALSVNESGDDDGIPGLPLWWSTDFGVGVITVEARRAPARFDGLRVVTSDSRLPSPHREHIRLASSRDSTHHSSHIVVEHLGKLGRESAILVSASQRSLLQRATKQTHVRGSAYQRPTRWILDIQLSSLSY